MGLKGRHWLTIGGAALVVVLLMLAPRTPSGRAEENAARAQEEHAATRDGATGERERAGMVSSDARVSTILGKLANDDAPMAAILELRKLAEDEPENAEAQYHMGVLSWETNQYDKAMEWFNKVIALEPEGYPDAYAYLAQAYVALDSTEQARAALDKYKTLVTDTALIHGAERWIEQLETKQ